MVSVIIVACGLFPSMCLFVLVNCLLNAFAICVGDVTVLSHHRFKVRFPIGLDSPFITLPFQGC